MKLLIEDLWSPDLAPPSFGLPANLASFRVFVQVALAQQGEPGREVFEFTVAPADRLAATEDGAFVSHVLVLNDFSWAVIRERLEKLLRHTESCANWQDAIRVLAGYLRWSDAP